MPRPAEPPAALDVMTSVRNALKLGGSLMVTYGIALAVRVLLPRYLGPEAFGQYNWAAEGFTASFFVLVGLGLEVYIRKEVALRPEHASEFFGGTLVLQTLLAVGLLAAMQAVMLARGDPPEVQALVLLLGAYQFFFRCNGTLAAVLHARERVDGLSVANIATKCVWGGGLLLVMVLGLSLPWLAVPILAAEVLKAGVLLHLARRHAGLVLRVDGRATRLALLAALPLFLSEAAVATYGRVNVFILGLIADNTEVGWYGAAWGLAGMALLITPIFGWVLMPLLSRAAAHSQEEFTRLTRRTLEAILTFSIPVTLALALGAETWIEIMYGEAFAPAAPVLRLLAPIFVLTYVAMVSATCLTVVGRAWTVTKTSVTTMVLNPLLNLVLIRPGLERFGPAGGASATALALALCELVAVTLLVSAIGRRAFDQRSLVMLAKTLGVCAVVVGVHLSLEGLGPARLVVDGAVYVFLVFATGAVRLEELRGLLRLVRRRGAPLEASAA